MVKLQQIKEASVNDFVDDLVTEMDVSEEDPDENPQHDETHYYEPVMTAKEMRERILELEKERDALNERAEMLEECLLEMSEVIYTGD